jgi:hypothetical protein
MKAIKISLLITGIFFLVILSYGQTSEFSTPEGLKWGMSRNEILKLNSGQPTKSDNEMIYYLNRETMNSLLYKFSDNKLIAITKKYGFETEDDLITDFEKLKKQLTILYGANYTKISNVTFQWIYKKTRIMLFNSFANDKMKVFITYEKMK